MQAANIDAAWGAFRDASEACGFDWLLYGTSSQPLIPGHRPDRSETLILCAHDDGYLDLYLDEELYLDNPMVEWISTHSGFISHVDLMAQVNCAPTRSVLRLAELRERFGYRSGYLGSFRGLVPGLRAGISMNTRILPDQRAIEDAWTRDGTTLQMLANAMHLRIATLPHPMLRPLSTRQREVLDWASQGKTTRDIAMILGVHEQTVDKHLRLAREALDATTTAHAVRKALQHNLLGS